MYRLKYKLITSTDNGYESGFVRDENGTDRK